MLGWCMLFLEVGLEWRLVLPGWGSLEWLDWVVGWGLLVS